MIEIIYADNDIAVINKPWDMLSVPGKGPEKQDCAWRRLQAEHPTARVVHRLDYATSGLMVFALHLPAQQHLSRCFQERTTAKRYQAVVSGIIAQEQGSVELPLRCDWDNRPLQIVDHEQGKHALTHWQVLAVEEDQTRVELTPVTGRSHQLRVHMQALGHPILGDRFYADAKAQAASERLLLHAEYLAFVHPDSQELMHFNAPCPF